MSNRAASRSASEAAVPPGECGQCPPWVVRCAHLPDGRELHISDEMAALPLLGRMHDGALFAGKPFLVTDGLTADLEVCPCGYPHRAWRHWLRTLTEHSDLPQAHAAFEEREAALERERLRDPEGSQ